MSKKYSQKEIDEALERINSGLLSTRKEHTWEYVWNNKGVIPEGFKKVSVNDRVKKINYGKRKMNTKSMVKNKNYREEQKGIMTPIVAYKILKMEKQGRRTVILDKTLIGTYECQKDASKDLNIPQGNINAVLSPKRQAKRYKNYTFEYV